MTALTELSIAYNQTQASDSLMTLPAGLFDKLVNLTTLRLEHNDLESLPDRIFQPLRNLTTLTFHGNPGSARFLPVAVAGPEGGIDAKAGEPVTLGGDADGPWGKNVTYSWRKATGTTVDLSVTDEAKPDLTAPALAEASALEYELTVTARGTSLTATDSVTVRVAAMAVVSSVALVLETGRRERHLQTGRDDRGGGHLFAAGDRDRDGEAAACAVGGDADPPGDLRPGHGHHPAGVRVHRAVGRRRRRRHRDRSEQPGAPARAPRSSMPTARWRISTTPCWRRRPATRWAGPMHSFDLSGGICERTPQLRDKLLELVKAKPEQQHAELLAGDDHASGGADRDAGRVCATRASRRSSGGISRISAGSPTLLLNGNDLTALPAGVFDGLDDTLTIFRLEGNDTADDPGRRLSIRLTGLTVLRLNENDLSSLPPRIFEKLTNLAPAGLSLHTNPGSARFKPTAKAGPAGGIDVASGGSVTLEVEGPENDDLWGTNVTYAWAPPAGTTVTYDGREGRGHGHARPSTRRRRTGR